MNHVYFDESGNTGEDLGNAADPIFVAVLLSLQSRCREQAAFHSRSQFRNFLLSRFNSEFVW